PPGRSEQVRRAVAHQLSWWRASPYAVGAPAGTSPPLSGSSCERSYQVQRGTGLTASAPTPVGCDKGHVDDVLVVVGCGYPRPTMAADSGRSDRVNRKMRPGPRLVLVIAVTVATLAVVYRAVGGAYDFFSSAYPLSATFSHLGQNVHPGSEVDYRGVQVGKIKSW